MLNKERIAAIAADMVQYRHHFHKNPELGFQETGTACVVMTFLDNLGVPYEAGYGNQDIMPGFATGIVATIDSGKPGREIMLRTDMDALAIQETTGVEYQSQNEGVMHACGHDGHLAMMMGTIQYLHENKDMFTGKVHCLFQPAEESYGGAKYVVADGLFTDYPNTEAIYGLHNWPKLPLGTFTNAEGAMMACSDTWRMTVKGTGGHGAEPHTGTDPMVATANIIAALQTIVARNIHPVKAGVVSVGHIQAGQTLSPNIIPAEVKLGGTARAYEPEVRDLVERRMGEISESIAAAYGCTVELEYNRRYPAVYNQPDQYAVTAKAATMTAGVENYNGHCTPSAGGEDFAFYLEHVPGALMFIGNGVDSESLHTPGFDFNDEIIPTGIEYFLNVVQVELGESLNLNRR